MNLLGGKTGGRFPVKTPPTSSDSARTHRSMSVLLRHSTHITDRSRSEAKQLQGTKQPRTKQPRKQNRRSPDASLTAKSRKHTGENIGVGMLSVTYSSSLRLMTTGDGTRRRTPPAIAGGALKAALSWSAVIPALIADVCISFCTVSVSCAARA